VIPAAVAFLLYYATLAHGLVWDDPVVLHQQLPLFRSVADVFVPPSRIPEFLGGVYYRPLVILSYLLDRSLWGSAAMGFHLSVIVLHALNSGLVTMLGTRLFGPTGKGRLAALTAGVLFAAHPIHTESVCWIAGRSDPLATAFMLAATVWWLDSRGSSRPLVATLGVAMLVLLGCLAKEIALGMVPVLIAADLLRPAEDAAEPSPVSSGRAIRRLAVTSWLPLGASAAVYLMMRRAGVSNYPALAPEAREGIIGSVSGLLRATGLYLRRLAVPVGLDVYIPTVPDPGLCWSLGIIGLVGSAVLLFVSLRRGRRRQAFLLVWFWATLAPSLFIVLFGISQAPMAERYLYLPSVAFCLIVGELLFLRMPLTLRLSPRRGLRTATLAAWILALLYSGGTLVRSRVWRSDLDLWADSVSKSPGEGYPHMMLGLVFDHQGRLVDAEREYLLAQRKDLNDQLAVWGFNNLGMIQADRGSFESADENFRKAIELGPHVAAPHYGLGLTAARRGEKALENGDAERAGASFQQAEIELRRALELDPDYAKAHAQLASVLHLAGRNAEAIEHIKIVERLATGGREYDLAEETKRLIDGAPRQ
jgi:Flp pilus assembly protein TadD